MDIETQPNATNTQQSSATQPQRTSSQEDMRRWQYQRHMALRAFNKRNGIPQDESFSDEVEIENEDDQKQENLVVRDEKNLFEQNTKNIVKDSDPILHNNLEENQVQKQDIQIKTEKRESQSYNFKSVKFWCFVCEKEFSKLRTDFENEVLCPDCNNITCEVEDNQDHPRDFVLERPSQPQTQPRQRRSRVNQPQNQQNLFGNFNSGHSQPQSNNFFSMTRQTIQRLPNGQTIVRTVHENPNQMGMGMNGMNNFLSNSHMNPMTIQNNGQHQQLQREIVGERGPNQMSFFDQMDFDPFFGGNDSFGSFGQMGRSNQRQGGDIHFNFFGSQNPFTSMNSGMPSMFRNLRFMDMGRFSQLLRQRGNRNQGPPPANETKINTLRTEVFTQEMAEKAKDNPCAICQEDPKCGEKITTLPCKHHYHEDCVKKWLKMHNSCPVCRKAI